jgi:hypothetical protein
MGRNLSRLYKSVSNENNPLSGNVSRQMQWTATVQDEKNVSTNWGSLIGNI